MSGKSDTGGASTDSDFSTELSKAVESASPKGRSVKDEISDAPDCYMCRILSMYTDQIECGRCGDPIMSNI